LKNTRDLLGDLLGAKNAGVTAAWHAVLMASAQNESGVLYSPSIVRTASINVQFFLSTMPFY
jgi:hypothetical protein